MDLLRISPSLALPISELRFRFSRSGGPGGQNVNRVSTRVELLFDVRNSSIPTVAKALLLQRLNRRVDSEGLLRIVSQESRSQWKNKQTAIEKFSRLLAKALQVEERRIPTRATKGSSEARLRRKKGRGVSKRLRRKDFGDDA